MSETCVRIDPYLSRLQRMRRAVLTAGRLMVEESSPSASQWVMVTMTYAPSAEWEPGHITQAVRSFRSWANRRSFQPAYLWVMELTQAGKPHYHMLARIPRSERLPKMDRRGWWIHGWTRTERARCAVGYLAKYVSKGCPSELLPGGARLYGVGGLGVSRLQWRWWMLPRYVRDVASPADDFRRICGGFVSRVSGEMIRSRWLFGGFGGGFIRMIEAPA